jgi:hypothetical protein
MVTSAAGSVCPGAWYIHVHLIDHPKIVIITIFGHMLDGGGGDDGIQCPDR